MQGKMALPPKAKIADFEREARRLGSLALKNEAGAAPRAACALLASGAATILELPLT
jgi:hypothetical protein